MLKRKKIVKKNPHAVLLGSLGGRARAKKLTQEQLSAIGRKGGRPRKNKDVKVAVPPSVPVVRTKATKRGRGK